MLGLALLDNAVFREGRGGTGLDAGAAGHAFGLSMKASPWPALTLESKPRPWMVSAKVPWVSSQARTQREQTMHLDGSKVK